MSNPSDNNSHQGPGRNDVTVFHVTVPEPELSAEEEERILSVEGPEGDRLRAQYNTVFPGRFPPRPAGVPVDESDGESDAPSEDSNDYSYAHLAREVTARDLLSHAELLGSVVERLTQDGDTVTAERRAEITRTENTWQDLTRASYYLLLGEKYNERPADYAGLSGPALKTALVSFEPADAEETTKATDLTARVLALYS